MNRKLSFSDALEAINEQRVVRRADVQSRALSRKVWVAEWHIPGCLSETQSYCLTKAEAIEVACSMAETEDGIPRGMSTALRKYERFDGSSPLYGDVITAIYQVSLSDLLA